MMATFTRIRERVVRDAESEGQWGWLINPTVACIARGAVRFAPHPEPASL